MKVLLLILCLFLLLGMGRFFGNPLDGKAVLMWRGGCEETVEWQGRIMGQPVAFAQPGDCVAFEPGLNVSWEACCVRQEDAACIGPAVMTEMPALCAAIFKPTGEEYDAEHVAEWNDAHVGD